MNPFASADTSSVLVIAAIYLFGYAFSMVAGGMGARTVTATIPGARHFSSELVGLVETAIYTTAWLLGENAKLFIAVWLGLKAVGQWEEMKLAEVRPIHNRWLVGTAVSLAFGVAGGLFIEMARADKWLKAFGTVGAVSLATWLLAWRGRVLAARNT